MSTEVVMPQMGESIAEGTITKWLKNVGDHVDRDEPLFEISTDKVDAEIPSPAAGTLTEVRFKEGDTVEVNTVVAVLDGAGAGASTAPAATGVASSEPQPSESAAAETKPTLAPAVSAAEEETVAEPALPSASFDDLAPAADLSEPEPPEIATEPQTPELEAPPAPVRTVTAAPRANGGQAATAEELRR